jgi:hypothetical protein
MYQAASGRIGLGTTSPLLHVNNDSITLSRTGTWPLILDQSGISTFTITNGGSPRFAVDGNGNVGIGTTTPSSLLHLYSPSLSAPGLTLETAGTPTASDIGAYIRFLRSGSAPPPNNPPPYSIVLAEEPGWHDSVSFAVYGVWNRIINFQQNGNVSIGFTPPTPDPTSMLTVNGMIESKNFGFKFPDGTVQTTAAGALSFSADHAEALKSQGEAVNKLESQNAALQQQIADLRAELESLRKVVEKGAKEK